MGKENNNQLRNFSQREKLKLQIKLEDIRNQIDLNQQKIWHKVKLKMQMKYKLKSAYEPCCPTSRNLSQFKLSKKRSRVFLLPLLNGMLVLRRVTPPLALNSPVPI